MAAISEPPILNGIANSTQISLDIPIQIGDCFLCFAADAEESLMRNQFPNVRIKCEVCNF
jgi:hypothetical protein